MWSVVAVRKTHPVLGQSDRIWYLDHVLNLGLNTIMQAMGAFACISVRWLDRVFLIGNISWRLFHLFPIGKIPPRRSECPKFLLSVPNSS